MKIVFGYNQKAVVLPFPQIKIPRHWLQPKERDLKTDKKIMDNLIEFNFHRNQAIDCFKPILKLLVESKTLSLITRIVRKLFKILVGAFLNISHEPCVIVKIQRFSEITASIKLCVWLQKWKNKSWIGWKVPYFPTTKVFFYMQREMKGPFWWVS